MLKGYMRDRAAMFGCLLICYGTLFLIGYLYDIPFEKTRYIAEFSGAGVFLCLLVDILKYAERWKELKRCIATSDTYPGMFYTVPGDLEALYRSMIAKMRQEKEELIFEDQKRYTEMMDYYGMWAQQIKTPIAAAALMASGLHGPQAARIKGELDRIEGYVEQALYYARSTSLVQDYAIRETSLAEAVREALRKHARFLIERGVAPTVDVDEDVRVFADVKWLACVIGQLVANAGKYGASTLRFSVREEGAGTSDARTVLEVADDGWGVPAGDVPRVFERAFTGENGRRAGSSTGMGLYLVAELCAKMGLAVALASEEGEGTRVLLAFPHDRRKLDLLS